MIADNSQLRETRTESQGGEDFASTLATNTEIQHQEFLLGPDKVVSIYVPPDQISPDASEMERSKTQLLDAYGSYRGRGDVIWPSSLQLARLIANCPSFVKDRKVLDLGCGLGLVSLATILGNPKHLVISDIDDQVLDLAERSCANSIEENNNRSMLQKLQKQKLDWTNPSTWPSEEIEVILASDILYDEDASNDVAKLIAHYLLSNHHEEEIVTKRAIIVDPINRENRDSFASSAAEFGLMVQASPFPGQEDNFVLINVIPQEDYNA